MGIAAQMALVADTPSLGASELSTVAAALQKQLIRDLPLFWDANTTLTAVTKLEDVPVGFWPIIVRDDIDNDAAGVHCDHSGQPMALVTFDSDWSTTASHEMLEMTVDPFGDRRVAGQSLKPDQGRVEYLVEVADPIGDSWYWVNDVKVSDFITARFFDPVTSSGVQYCYTGRIQSPHEVLAGGYLTWFDPVGNHWWQQSRFTNGPPTIDDIGIQPATQCGMRSVVDRLAARRRRASGRASARVLAAENDERRKRGIADAKRAKAESWRRRIELIKEEAKRSRNT